MQEVYHQNLSLICLTSLTNLLELEREIQKRINFLENIQQGSVQPEQRYDTFQWMKGPAEHGKMSAQAIQKAFYYVDIMLSQLTCHPESLPLIGISSLILAAKVDEKQRSSMNLIDIIHRELPTMDYFKDISNCRQKISKCEVGILNFCQWRAHIPTPIEFIQLLLGYVNASQNFSQILQECEEYTEELICIYEMANYKSSTLGFVSLQRICQRLGFVEFMDGIVEIVNREDLNFDLVDIRECSLLLKQFESGQKISNSPIPTQESVQQNQEELNTRANSVTSQKDTYQAIESSPDIVQNRYRNSIGSISTQSSNSLSFLQSPFLLKEDCSQQFTSQNSRGGDYTGSTQMNTGHKEQRYQSRTETGAYDLNSYSMYGNASNQSESGGQQQLDFVNSQSLVYQNCPIAQCSYDDEAFVMCDESIRAINFDTKIFNDKMEYDSESDSFTKPDVFTINKLKKRESQRELINHGLISNQTGFQLKTKPIKKRKSTLQVNLIKKQAQALQSQNESIQIKPQSSQPQILSPQAQPQDLPQNLKLQQNQPQAPQNTFTSLQSLNRKRSGFSQ
eukprot:403353414